MIPAADTFRMRWLFVSAIRKPPSAVGTALWGPARAAAVALPPSPEKPFAPEPATVEMSPGAASAVVAETRAHATVRTTPDARVGSVALTSIRRGYPTLGWSLIGEGRRM